MSDSKDTFLKRSTYDKTIDEITYAKVQLKLPAVSTVFLYSPVDSLQVVDDLLPLFFSLRMISQLHQDTFYLYLIIEGDKEQENIKLIAEQATMLNIANYVFFSFNPSSATKRLIFTATNYMLGDCASEKDNFTIKTTADGQYLLEGLHDVPVKTAEQKILSKSLLQALLIQALPACCYHQFCYLKQDPVTFYYTLFWAVAKNLLGTQVVTTSQIFKKKYCNIIVDLYCHEKLQKNSCLENLSVTFPDNDRRAFIEPFVQIILSDLNKAGSCLPFSSCWTQLLSQLLQPFINKLDAYFFQSLAMWGRDFYRHSMVQKELLKAYSPTDFMKMLTSVYPYWSILVIRDMRHQLRSAKQFINRLKTDWSVLKRFVSHPQLARLTKITFLSDKDYHGPIALYINEAPALVYKQRDLRIEARICGCSATSYPTISLSLAELFNQWHKEQVIKPLTFICMKDAASHDYGYISFVQRHLVCSNKVQAQRLGQLSVFALFCGLADLHDGNVFYCQNNSVALTDSKYSFSPLIFDRLSRKTPEEKTGSWETSALEATNMENLWNSLPDYKLKLCSVMLNSNDTIEFQHKSDCIIKKDSYPLFSMIAEHLPLMEEGFFRAWKLTQKHSNTLRIWFKSCKAIKTCRFSAKAAQLLLYQQTMMTCSAFYSSSLSHLYWQTRQYLKNTLQEASYHPYISSHQMHQQVIHCLNNQPFLFYARPDIDSWIVMTEKLLKKGKNKYFLQILYTQPLKDWLFYESPAVSVLKNEFS